MKEPATDEAVEVFSKCLGKGVLFGLNARAEIGNVVKMKPPLAVSTEEADKTLDIFDRERALPLFYIRRKKY